MAKKKSSGGLTKQHGPKRKLFHDYSSTMRIHMAEAGLLDKYSNYESFKLSCMARGIKNPTLGMYEEMSRLKTKQAKDEWFKALRK